MALPFSRSQFDKLGKRLAQSTVAAPADLAMLAEAYGTYNAVLQRVEVRLEAHGHFPVVRLKTTPVLIDKLRRSPGITISNINDIAGARIIVPPIRVPAGTSVGDRVAPHDFELGPGRLAQTIATQSLVAQFTAICANPPVVLDRRLDGADSHGYRAVHIILRLDAVPVEVQLRTPLQHTWAEVSERLGDRWGRELRYGGSPQEASRPVVPGLELTRREVITALREWSAAVDEYERVAEEVDNAELAVGMPPPGGVSPELLDEITERREQIDSRYAELAAILKALRVMVDRME